MPEGDYLWRGGAAALLGIAAWNSGDLEAAYRSFVDGMASLQMTGYIHLQLMGAPVLADIRVAQGRLHEAIGIYEQSLQLAAGEGEQIPMARADLHVGLSELHLEQNDLEAATERLLTQKELGEHAGLPEYRHRQYIVMARMREARGDLDGALALLDEAERVYIRGPDPDVRPVAALKTRAWVAQGRLAQALGWVRERDLSVDDDLSYVREFEHITLARVLIAGDKSERKDHSIHEAVGLLERLLKAAEEGKRTGSVIEVLLLQALAHEAQGNLALALVPLERALTLAEPEGYFRIFVDEGAPMAAMLRGSASRGVATAYVSKLLNAFDAQDPIRRGPADLASPMAQPLEEPLTDRELEVLRLVATGMSNRDIARELVLATGTVKKHINNIFTKLDVRSRTQAVAQATELGLL